MHSPTSMRTMAILGAVLVLLAAAFSFVYWTNAEHGNAPRADSSNEVQPTIERELAEVELASAAANEIPTEAAPVAGTPLEAAASRRAATETQSNGTWSALLAPFDEVDGQPIADARIWIVSPEGALHRASLSDPVGPNDLVEGAIGVLDGEHHFSRLFRPHELVRTIDPVRVSLCPCATIRIVLGSGVTRFPEASRISLRANDAIGRASRGESADLEDVLQENSWDTEPIADYGDRLCSAGLSDASRRRQARWILRSETARALFALDAQPILGLRARTLFVPEPSDSVLECRVAADSVCRVDLHFGEEPGTIWGLSTDPTRLPDEWVRRLDGVPTPAKGGSSVIALHNKSGALVEGRFPVGSQKRFASLVRGSFGDPDYWHETFEVEDGGRIGMAALEPGAYRLFANWVDADDVHCSVVEKFDLETDELHDLGTLGPAPDTKRVTIVPVLRIDGEVATEVVLCSFQANLYHDQDEGETEESGRRIYRSGLESFDYAGLTKPRYYLRLDQVEFEGEWAQRLRWEYGWWHGHHFDLSQGEERIELMIEARSAQVCTIAFEVPATNSIVDHELRAAMFDSEAGTSFRVDFDPRWVEGSQQASKIETSATVPPGRYDVFVVVTSSAGLIPVEEDDCQWFAGRAQVDVSPGVSARVEVPLVVGASCTGSIQAIVGEAGLLTTQLHFAPVGTSGPSQFLWYSEPHSITPGGFIVRGLLPQTEYEIDNFATRVVAGPSGSTTDM